MSEIYAIFMLLMFSLGILIGSVCTCFLIARREMEIYPVYVDDENDSKRKRYFSFKRKCTDKNEDKEDENDNGLLEYRLVDGRSITEQICNFDGTEISEVLQKQQDKVDNDFEYLSKNATK